MTRMWSTALCVLVGASAPWTSAAWAQGGDRVTRTPEELLAGLRAAPRGGDSPILRDFESVIARPEDYPRPDLERLLQGLEDLATHGEQYDLRIAAVVALFSTGARGKGRPLDGTVQRLVRVYETATDGSVRSAILMLMPGVADRVGGVIFLEQLASEEPGARGYPWSVRNALGALAGMDEEGRAALRRLHQASTVVDPEARAFLAEVAARDFRSR